MTTLLAESLDPLLGITDFSAVTPFESIPERMRKLVSFPPIIRNPSRLRVVVAPDEDIFKMARVFEIAAEATRPNLHVVRSLEEGWAIFGIEEPQFESISEAYDSQRFDKGADHDAWFASI
jgi:hypothetical protein